MSGARKAGLSGGPGDRTTTNPGEPVPLRARRYGDLRHNLGAGRQNLPVGIHWPLEGHNASTLVFKTGRPARAGGHRDREHRQQVGAGRLAQADRRRLRPGPPPDVTTNARFPEPVEVPGMPPHAVMEEFAAALHGTGAPRDAALN
jgi:hypothetical protein